MKYLRYSPKAEYKKDTVTYCVETGQCHGSDSECRKIINKEISYSDPGYIDEKIQTDSLYIDEQSQTDS